VCASASTVPPNALWRESGQLCRRACRYPIGSDLALYAVWWRDRQQIGDLAFTTCVLIVERLLFEMSDVAQLSVDRLNVRAWRSVPAQDGL